MYAALYSGNCSAFSIGCCLHPQMFFDTTCYYCMLYTVNLPNDRTTPSKHCPHERFRLFEWAWDSSLGFVRLQAPTPTQAEKTKTNPHRMQTCIEFSVCVLGLFSCGFNALSPKPTNLKSKDLENVTEVLAVCYFGFGVPNAVETWAF